MNTIIPNDVDSIDILAFFYCDKMTSITIPKNVMGIGKQAFYGCSNLTSVTVEWEKPIKIRSWEFQGCRNKATLYVPIGTKAAYEAADVWKDFKEIVEMEKVSEIQLSAKNVTLDLDNNTSLTLTATVLPENAVNKNVTWSSSNPEVAIVEDGYVTAVDYGTTLITASATDGSGVSASCKVTVQETYIPESDTDISLLDNVIYLEKTEAHAGSTATLSFKMKNSAAIRGFQFDLYLPEGVTAVKNANDRIQGSLSKGCLGKDDDHTLTLQEQTDGAIRFLCGSQYNESFMGNEGEVATLQINIADDMADGEYSIVLKEMRLSETDISRYYDTKVVKSTLVLSYTLGDINGDGIVNVSDYIGIANYLLGSTPTGFIVKAADLNEDNTIDMSDYNGVGDIIKNGSPSGNSSNKVSDLQAMDNVIYVEPITVDKGTTRATLSFMMKNTAAIRGFQFDLYLPDGMTAVKNANGRIQSSLNSRRLPEDDQHTLTIQTQPDGAIRFLCVSLYDETFTGNNGEIATLEVSIAENLSDGKYPIILKAMRLSESDISKFFDADDVETTITVMLVDGIIATVEDNGSAILYNLSGQRVERPRKGIYIQGGKKVLVK